MTRSTTQRIATLALAAVAVTAIGGTVSGAGDATPTCQTWHARVIVDDRYQHTWNPDDAIDGRYQHTLNPDVRDRRPATNTPGTPTTRSTASTNTR